MAGCSKKQYAVMMSAGEEGKKLASEMGSMEQDKFDEAFSELLENGAYKPGEGESEYKSDEDEDYGEFDENNEDDYGDFDSDEIDLEKEPNPMDEFSGPDKKGPSYAQLEATDNKEKIINYIKEHYSLDEIDPVTGKPYPLTDSDREDIEDEVGKMDDDTWESIKNEVNVKEENKSSDKSSDNSEYRTPEDMVDGELRKIGWTDEQIQKLTRKDYDYLAEMYKRILGLDFTQDVHNVKNTKEDMQ